jgi:hypothetical protein
MRNAARITFAFVAFYVCWKFRNTPIGQSSFVVATAGLFIDEWFMSQVRQRTPRRRKAGPGDAHHRELSAVGSKPSNDGDVVTVLVTTSVVAVMADSFFFTTWLDLPDVSGSSGVGALAALVKVIASLLALTVALIAPMAVGLLVYVGCSDWIDSRSGSQSSPGGCIAILPAVIVWLACYGHFYVAYLFYDSIGALRSHG